MALQAAATLIGSQASALMKELVTMGGSLSTGAKTSQQSHRSLYITTLLLTPDPPRLAAVL